MAAAGTAIRIIRGSNREAIDTSEAGVLFGFEETGSRHGPSYEAGTKPTYGNVAPFRSELVPAPENALYQDSVRAAGQKAIGLGREYIDQGTDYIAQS